MIEVEMKFQVPDVAELKNRLRENGFIAAGSPLSEADHYFNSSTRDFAQTDEALRIRVTNQKRACLTYKGPKQGPVGKVRTEIEVEVGQAEEMKRILLLLSFRSVAVVRKERQYFRSEKSDGMLICVDQVDSVGCFTEIECVVDEKAMGVALERIKKTAAQLGLISEERRSYLELLLNLTK